MSRKLFLSFLGITNYEPVNYYLDEARKAGVSPLEKYVQKTLLDHLAAPFGPDDLAVILLTEEARERNWESGSHQDNSAGAAMPAQGLEQQVRQAAYSFPVKAVMVEGESEKEAIWSTFQTVYDQIEAGDEVYFDITHSWRYLPMLGMTLLNYAKVLKQIEVKAIYYGALERLGSIPEVRKLPLDERPVPILNLVSFSDLQDWTVAADDFVRNGNPERLSRLTHNSIRPILTETKGKDQVAANLRDINQRLASLTTLLATNRGNRLWQFDFQGLDHALGEFSAEDSYIKPVNGVIDHIRHKVRGFVSGNNLQWLEGVNWCISHGLIQQGLTQLQEGLLSWLCIHYEQKGWAEAGYFDWSRRHGRNLLSAALQFIPDPPPEEEWNGEVGKHPELTYRVMEDPPARALSQVYRALSKGRNDINHGGYVNDSKPEKFIRLLEDCYRQIREIVLKYSPSSDAERTGLLNISNHPSGRWPQNQRQTARERFGEVKDLPFPNIDPQMDSEKLQDLVKEYYEQVNRLQPAAVHLMGEMTFTFALVQKLKAAGIPCVASTTERLVEEKDGQKSVRFEFVQFRAY